MASHESLNVARRTGSASDTVGRWVPIAGRVGADYPWTVTLDAGDVESGTTTVRYEASPDRSVDALVTLVVLSTLATPAQVKHTVTLSGYLSRGYLRAVANINGTLSVGTREEADFFSVIAESERLSSQVGKWPEVAQAADRAERDLLDPYRARYGTYSLDMAHPSFGDDLRTAIAEQIEHRYQLWALGRATDPASKVTLRHAMPVDRSARSRVARYGPIVHL